MKCEVPICDKTLLVIPEAAALTGVPEKVIRAQVRSGRLPVRYALSSTARIRRRDLDDWVNALPTDLRVVA